MRCVFILIVLLLAIGSVSADVRTIFYDNADIGNTSQHNWSAGTVYSSARFVSSPNSTLFGGGANYSTTINTSGGTFPISARGSFYDDGTNSDNAKFITLSNSTGGCTIDLQLGNTTGFYAVRDPTNCGTTQADKDGDVARTTAWHTFNITYPNSTWVSIWVDGTLMYNRNLSYPMNITTFGGYTQGGTTINVDDINVTMTVIGIEWLQLVSDFTGNHNASRIWYSDFNATNTTTTCNVTNYTSNNTHWPINLTTGVVNISGSNISKSGFFSVVFVANSNCSETINQTIALNITNNAPNCTSPVNVSINRNSNATLALNCTDIDGDTFNYSDNTTDFNINQSGNLTFNVTFVQRRNYLLTVNDTPTSNNSYSWSVSGIGTFNFTVETLNTNLSLELNTKVNATLFAASADDVVCIDIIHSSYGINTTCALGETNITFNISHFRRTMMNDTNVSKNLTFTAGTNHTINISAHAYDQVDRLTLNLRGHQSGGTFPSGVRIYINNTLSNTVGLLVNTTTNTLTVFNDSASSKNLSYLTTETKTAGYYKIPKLANVSIAYVYFSGSSNFTYQENYNSISSSESSGFVYQNYTKPTSVANTSLWQVKFFAGSTGILNTTNISFSYACWNYNANVIMTRIEHENTQIDYECYNGTGWTELFLAGDLAGGCTTDGQCQSPQSSVSYLYDGSYDTWALFAGAYGYWCTNACDDRAFAYEDGIWWNAAPVDPWMEVGSINGTRDWNFSNGFTLSNNRSNNFSAKLNSYLSTCTQDADGYCSVPMYVYGSSGQIVLNATNITYTYDPNPVQLNATIIENYLIRYVNQTTIPVRISSETTGIVEIINLSYDYAGGNNTILVRGHLSNYSINSTYNLTYYHSRWNLTFPANVDFLEFIPARGNSKNVTPYGQTPGRPIFNITNMAYGDKTFNYSILLNATISCVNLSIGNTSNRSLAKLLTANNTWYEIVNQSQYNQKIHLWMWADYACNYSRWTLYSPDVYLRACAHGTLCGNETV